MAVDFKKQGIVFWPVGCGDSTSIVVTKDVVLHVDLHHMAQSESDENPATPVVDRLVELLPKKGGKPFLAGFALTHPDQDHCRGFADLLKQVTIGEIWFTPRVFREYKKDLCDDAKAFCKEVTRRVDKTIAKGGNVDSGDRVRIIGYDEILAEDEYKGFPKSRLTIPGNNVTELDGIDYSTYFRAYIHAPFKDDADGDRNDTSLAFQLTLKSGSYSGTALLFGDLSYPILKRIFERTTDKMNKNWNVLLAPHHCSKGTMYWKDEGQEDETLRQDILDHLEKNQLSPGVIVSSSYPIPDRNEPGDNPPHAKAKARYEEIVANDFICTHEHKGEAEPHAIVFEVTEKGLVYSKPTVKAAPKRLAQAVAAARGGAEPPRERVGFGA